MQIPGMLALHRSGTLDPIAPCEVAPIEAGAIPLVLLHGFPLDARMWGPVADELPDLPVIAIDLPGFGDSPTVAEVAFALDRDADADLGLSAEAVRLSLLVLAACRRAVVVGLSMGGYVTMALARRSPDLLAGVGFCDTKAEADTEQAAANRLRIAQEVAESGALTQDVWGMNTSLLAERNRTGELADEMAAWIADAPPESVAWTQRAMAARPDSHAAIASLRVPGAVVVGAEDELAPPDVMRGLAASLRDAHVTEIAGAGHMTAVEDPQATAAALRRLYLRATGLDAPEPGPR